ncbi:hypothetical protein NP233_g11373 [Leucocoprinus birnbaumii]|uniref:Carboxylase:pyruvate/acetyl-coa/propionyl-CoA n=1 Tax=Leucocoprinus birnbaumii TaxID=56174 RepID=A0AAD5VJ23_9AGAR|nr:hypothetical protein NP233_g11373 [Leucocoprinus birnbaumii]
MVVPKVLVANRGEIAIRVLRSARELGWRTVALYTTEPTPDASHATYADEAVKLDDVAQYMNVAAIVRIAVANNCTHVHPGYGFLSESPGLATALAQLNPPVTFVGPAPDALRLAGDKMLSRDLATSLGVEVAPGTRVGSSDDVRAFATRSGVGYPIMIKALDGGGGRGIRVVREASEVEEAFKRCLGESPSGQVFAEKALTGPGWKHIEIQVIGDGTGAVNHFWERECSIQRRFQKIVEIAPSRLPRTAVQPLITASLKIAAHLNYKGLGTFEFLVNASIFKWVFLEINPRVQVEHTITEEIMDIDLVRAQLLLFLTPPTITGGATLASLGLSNPPPPPSSAAVQLRLTAENPEIDFRLSPGTIHSSDIHWPAGRGIRVDTWLSSSPSSSSQGISEWMIGTDFDSLLAKLIIRAGSFDEVTQKAKRALRELSLGDRAEVKTNLEVLAGVLEHPDWNKGEIDTLWLERHLPKVLSLGKAVIGEQRRNIPGFISRAETNSTSTSGGTSNLGTNTLLQPGSLFHLTLSPSSPSSSSQQTRHTLTLTSISHNAFPFILSGTLQTTFPSTPTLSFSLSQSSTSTNLAGTGSDSGFELANPNDPTHIGAPLTGKVVEMHRALSTRPANSGEGEGDGGRSRRVKKGETLVVLSVMKMENTIVAPFDGVVERAGRGLKVGGVFGEGMLVCVVRPDSLEGVGEMRSRL